MVGSHHFSGSIVALAVVSLACQGTPTTPVPSNASELAGAGATSTVIPFDQLVFVPCAIDGAGEFLLISGNLHIVSHQSVDANSGFHSTVHFQPQDVRGEGQTSGDIYQGTGVTRENFYLADGGLPFTRTFVNNFRMIGQGPGNNLLVHETVHLTFDANGNLTANVGNLSMECR